MNKFILILFLFCLACHANNDSNIAFLDEGIKRCNSQIENINDCYYTDAEEFIKENPGKNKVHKINVDKIHLSSRKLFDAIEFRKAEINKTNINDSINQPEKIDLLNSVTDYKNLLDSLFPKDSIIQNKIREFLNINKSDLKKYQAAELNLLINKIQIINHIALKYFARKMDGPKYNPHKKEIAVIPKNRYLHYKDIYEAELYLISYDTAANVRVTLENKNLKIINGKAFYSDTINSIPDIIKKQGVLRFYDYFTEFSYDFPFTLTYQIKAK
jgi:hypothetical protein